MSRGIFSTIMLGLFLYNIIFSSCQKDRHATNNGSSIIEAKNVIGANNNITTVKALLYAEDGDVFEVASGKFVNNGFKLTLKETIPDKYLNISASEMFGAVNIDNNARLGMLIIVGYDNAGKEIGSFVLQYDWAVNYANYFYADRKFTANGYLAEELLCDCSFGKGWNILYVENDKEDLLMTTKKPQVERNWFFQDSEL